MATKSVRDWQCNECKRFMTFQTAQRAIEGDDGCPKCGGVDIEPAVNYPTQTRKMILSLAMGRMPHSQAR